MPSKTPSPRDPITCRISRTSACPTTPNPPLTSPAPSARSASGCRPSSTAPRHSPTPPPRISTSPPTPIYSAVDAKPKASPDLKRLRNIAGHHRVTLLVDHYDDDWRTVWWVRVDGTAIVHDIGTEAHERGRTRLAAKYDQYAEAPG